MRRIKLSQLAIKNDRDLISAIAMDIGEEVKIHIENMYPQAVKSSPDSLLLSVRNCVYNRIMWTFDPRNLNNIEKTLAVNKRFRKFQRESNRKMRTER